MEEFEEDEGFTTLWREELLDSDSHAGRLREKRPASIDQRLWRTHDLLDVKFLKGLPIEPEEFYHEFYGKAIERIKNRPMTSANLPSTY